MPAESPPHSERNPEHTWERYLELMDENTRLQEQLKASRAALAAFFSEWDGDVGTYAPTDDTLDLMRAASTPASGSTERSGNWALVVPDDSTEGRR